MKPESLRPAVPLAFVCVLAVAAAFVLDGDPRWLTDALLIVGGAAFIPATIAAIFWWAGVDPDRIDQGTRRANALLAGLFGIALVLNVFALYRTGLDRGSEFDLGVFGIGAMAAGVALFVGRALGRDPWTAQA